MPFKSARIIALNGFTRKYPGDEKECQIRRKSLFKCPGLPGKGREGMMNTLGFDSLITKSSVPHYESV